MKIATFIAGSILAMAANAAMAQGVPGELGSLIGEVSRSIGTGGEGEGGQLSGRLIQLIGLLTLLSLAPGLIIMMTSFTRFVIVFSMLRSALGLGQTPPNMVLTSLAMFMTFFVMQPVFQTAWDDGLAPLVEGSITEEQALPRIAEPFHRFMLANTREADLALFAQMAAKNAKAAEEGSRGVKAKDTGELLAAAHHVETLLPADRSEVAWSTLVPAFMISELRRAFTIGFLIYLPFIVIDLITSSVLMSAGMMMLSPVMISLPFKVIFFVLTDGWYRLAGSMMQSYAAMPL
ncbi:flagellar type III secretion system pore protein FliP [Paracoccus litorisediminis]|uniref:flagellar type III secretion system pore protein FliP n=1 Tax=Paracoccus litorisediminis TaxID=2006130 RepID=UPI00372EF2B5